MTAPTPRDLFGSRGRLPRHQPPIRINPVIGPPNEGPSRPTADVTNDTGHLDRPRRPDYRRPAAGYGSAAFAVAHGLNTMALHEGDELGHLDRVPIRATRRELTDPPGRCDIVTDPRQPGARGPRPACADGAIDPERFSDPGQGGFTPQDKRELGRICGYCPIKEACREWAIAHHEHGWWGGTDAPARAKIRAWRKQEAEGLTQ